VTATQPDVSGLQAPTAAAADLDVPSARRPQPAPRRGKRLAGLDGVRGLAALFVVLHHTYLMAYPGFPRVTGPLWAGWMIYGHFAVAVFIVLSGFSLAVAPARAGWRVDNTGKFFFRRAWRILPTYWPALVFSLAVAWWITTQPGEAVPTGKSVVVNGLLLQDIFGAPSPNGAFWSIAVEAQLYFLFPLLIIVMRRHGAGVMLGLLGAAVIAVGAIGPHSSIVGKLLRLTPQFALLFGLGIVAAGVVRVSHRKRPPLAWLALIAAVPVIVAIVARGSGWTLTHLFWVDVALGPAIALLVAAIATGRPHRMVSVLDSRPLRSLGSFSYSLYLVHAPIVVAWYILVIQPWLGHGTGAFLMALATGVPLAIIISRVFAAFFELPFTRNKSWPALRGAIQARIARLQRRRPAAVAQAEVAS
jgi:peptidoglycan/LPS O-acetylase OafA/YrhL